MERFQQLVTKAQQAEAQGQMAQALALWQQALTQSPQATHLYANCGNLCVQLHRYAEATHYFRAILEHNPSVAVQKALCYALQALGNVAHREGNFKLAAACFSEALSHQGNHAAYWYNLGNAQRELGQFEAAAASFQQAIIFAPTDAETYNNLGNVQRELGQLSDAIACYEKALALNPNLHHALVHLIHQKQHICDWQGLTEQITTVVNWVNQNINAKISPFAFLAMPGTTAQAQKLCASQYLAESYQQVLAWRDSLYFTYKPRAQRRIKLGYLSADFRLHPLAFLITELIEHHDRTQFEVYAYAYGKHDQTPTRQRLIQAFDHFVDINADNTLAAAQKIHADGIDILIDLTGFTHNSRSEIIALKPAPISISWLGFPGSMGEYQNQPLFDYLIADKTVAPDADDYCEKLLYLPCYQPNSSREIGPLTNKTAHFLPEQAFIFCCFNQTFKITAEMFALWMRLLVKKPDSVLWLLDCNKWAKANLQQAATHAGVAPNRLIFAPRMAAPDHLERQRHIDLFLDTLPYNAHTTASDALWMGVPVITCPGETFASRVAASLLKRIAVDDLICDSLMSYEQKALSLASNPTKLRAIKQHLSQQKLDSALFNAQQFARDLETAYHSVLITKH